MEVTVILSGIPQCNPRISLQDLAYHLDKLFDTDEIGTFKVRELATNKNQVALDFKSGYDAMYATGLLDGKSYNVNGVIGVLRAKVSRDPKHKPEVPLSESLKIDCLPEHSMSSSSVVDSQLLPVSNRLLIRENKIDAKLKMLKIKKKAISTEEDLLLLEREKLRRELEQMDDIEGSPPRKRARSRSSESDESKSKSKKSSKKKSSSKRKRKRLRKRSETSTSGSEDQNVSSSGIRESRESRDSFREQGDSSSTQLVVRRSRDVMVSRSRDRMASHSRDSHSRDLQLSRSRDHRVSPSYDRQLSRSRSRVSPSLDRQLSRSHDPRVSPSLDRQLRRSRSRVSPSRDLRLSRSSVDRPRDLKDRISEKSYKSIEISRSSNQTSSYTSKLGSSYEKVHKTSSDGHSRARERSGYSSTSSASSNVVPRRPPRPESRRNQTYESVHGGIEYHPNVSDCHYKQSNEAHELRWESVEETKEELEAKMMEFTIRREELRKKQDEAIKGVLLELETIFRELCEKHKTCDIVKSKILKKLFGIVRKRMKCIKLSTAMTVSDAIMHYRCKYSKIEDKDLVNELFNELETTHSDSPESAPPTSTSDGLWNVLDTVLQEFNLPSLTDDIKTEVDSKDNIKTEMETQEEEVTNITINLNPITRKPGDSINDKQKDTITPKQENITDDNQENPTIKQELSNGVEQENSNCNQVEQITEDETKKNYTVYDNNYYVNITIYHNRPKKYYITIKTLLHKMKCYITKYESYVAFDLLEYVMRRILEQQIAEILNGRQDRVKAKALLKLYRESYPEEEDENFVLQTLYEIWEGKHNDSEYKEDVSNNTRNVDLTKVKKEVEKPQSEKPSNQETSAATENVSKETPEAAIKNENAMEIDEETDQTKSGPKEIKSGIKKENCKDVKLEKIDSVKNVIEKPPVPLKQEVNDDNDVTFVENSNNGTIKSETVKSEKPTSDDVMLIESTVEVIDLSDTEDTRKIKPEVTEPESKIANNEKSAHAIVDLSAEDDVIEMNKSNEGEFDFAGDKTTQNVATEATVDRKSFKRNKNVKCNAGELKDAETKNKIDNECSEVICLSDDEIVEVIDDDRPELQKSAQTSSGLKLSGHTNNTSLQNSKKPPAKSEIVSEEKATIDLSESNDASSVDTLILGEDSDIVGSDKPVEEINVSKNEENIKVSEEGDAKEVSLKLTVTGGPQSIEGNKLCDNGMESTENNTEETNVGCSETNSDFNDDNICESVENIKQYLNSITDSVADS